MKKAICFLGLAALMMTAALPAEAKKRQRTTYQPVPTYISVTDLATPVQAALSAKAKGRNVIVIFDIDNTLLTMPQDLGSDTWFNWQRSQDDSDDAFDALLRNNTFFLQASTMTPTQADSAALVRQLQAAGIPVYALSARGTALRGATEAALKANGIDLTRAPECGPPLCIRRGDLRDKEIRYAARWVGLKLPAGPYRPVTVSDGVMLVNGQDKGVMLNLLLRSLPARYNDVYFVDDTFHNVENVQNASPRITAKVHPYSYERYWPDAEAFMKDAPRQAKSDEEFARIKASLCAAVRAHICEQ
ncbi:DUF2608 domain-containing protein [Asticcacaulis sp. AC460]|uniref:DUF2608 domain-containing protein n=1 Tax=Asticcacaulis sp. AC460 TaxID=1282360 RepID=UPI0012DF32C4|nr:DUF2608 domain-containing protein [Asticcacaulis sp. AC460]